MTKISTADCKAFLSEQAKTNLPMQDEIAYSMGWEARQKVLSDSKVPNNWKRELKVRPGKGDSFTDEEDGCCFLFDGDLNPLDIKTVAWERVFCLKPDVYDTAIRFVVFEDIHGKLHLGEFVGD